MIHLDEGIPSEPENKHKQAAPHVRQGRYALERHFDLNNPVIEQRYRRAESKEREMAHREQAVCETMW